MTRPRLIAWIEPEHRPWLASLLDARDVELVALGSPRAGQVAALAETFGVPVVPDVRHAALHGDADVLWIATRAPLDEDEARALRESGLRAVASEPRPLLAGERVRFVPLLRRSPGWLAARDAAAEFGPPQAVAVECRAAAGRGSLSARLFDALDVVEHVCGGVERVDAGIAGLLPGVPHDDAPLTGHVTVNLRFRDHRCAAIAASDRGGAWYRRVTLLGEAGALTITDGGFRWEQDGACVDEQHLDPPPDPGRLVGRQIARLHQGLDVNEPPADARRLLALCETVRLSARTGEGESPSRMLEMMTRV